MLIQRPRLRGKGKSITGWSAVYIIMTFIVVFMALPLVYTLSSAFKPLDELYIFPPRFWVSNPTFKNFLDLVSSIGSASVPFSRNVLNSVIVTVATVTLTCAVSAAGAYGMVIYRPPGSNFLYNVVVSALMFSPHVTQIPRYMVVNGLGLVDNYLALIIPGIAVAYNFFLLRQFLISFPKELVEAGRIDGAGELGIFRKLVLPAMKPALATLVVLSFVANWNDYFSALIYTSDQAMRTLPLALQTISGGSGAASIGSAGAAAAASLIMILPTITIFTLSQKKVMETMVLSGIKG